MENDEMDVNRWVEQRLQALDPAGDWRPDSSVAFARLKRREAPPRRRWWLWAAVSAAAAAGCAISILVSIPSACANPLGCRSAGAVAGAPAPRATPVSNGIPGFKESGSPGAPVTCELYADFECPHCATFYLDTLPRLSSEYIETGKVRLIHRDDPLPHHRYARLAALYADAAGEAGYYQAVAAKLYRTQAVWSVDGDIDAQVARVVPASAMEKVRAEVRQDRALAVSITADEAQARTERVDRTPTLICNGKVIGPDLTIPRIEAQLDPLVLQR